MRVVTIPILIRDISSGGVGFLSGVGLESGASVEIDADISFFNLYLSKQGKVVYCFKVTEGFFRLGLDFGYQKIVFKNEGETSYHQKG
ncbi:MAG: hypothetical protein DRP61_03215 [Candidatus Omnitrophota bacterium]|nr:MAG: hypothetical protein DRP61_03215 [Candidatus Omnitrophota bacterium]RKY34435.1 MAG: hypothetical protein DRP69_04660 [Candidatus Omnitrophota bacterium]RKY44065.1 MAG: hypothetical protein DRP80_03400 [Candidatus Omnitrophota bacterium]